MTVFLWMILVGAIVGGMVFFISRDKGVYPRQTLIPTNISEPVSEMIRIIESGEGFTFRDIAGYDDHYVRFGERPEIFVSLSRGGYHNTDQEWMTKDEKIALVRAFYNHLEKNKLTANDQERERWCKMLGVSQNI